MKTQYGILRFKKYKGPAISPIEAQFYFSFNASITAAL